MTKYSRYFEINKNIQSSINIELDLDNESKIEEYIPTADICAVLKIYFEALNNKTKNHATLLVGPYGKGKSFLLLILSYLMHHDYDETYKSLLDKINNVDSELFAEIEQYNKNHKKLLPVIINSNYDNIEQAFMLGLNEALDRDGIKDIVPETVFGVCINLLKKWEKDPEQKKRFDLCAAKYNTNYRKLLSGLNDYSSDAYEKFKYIYDCITSGLSFNPLVNNDILKIYDSVNYQLTEHYGYSGIFIIFDEFSKFIESSGKNLMKDLKIIQDFAELSVRSGKNAQINLCCVTHKSIDLYGENAESLDAIQTVEGRFKEVKFNRSLDENYEIITSSIRHKKGADKVIDEYLKNHHKFYKEISESQPYQKITDIKKLESECFPLNPMTVYLLIGLSEKVAQNERTLFTFLSDTDDHSLNFFLQRKDIDYINNESPDKALFNAEEIYGYFAPLFQKETDKNIRNIWYRTEGCLSNINDEDSRKVIRTLAVILMLDDNNRIAPTDENISIASGIEQEKAEAIISSLTSEHYIRRNLVNNLLSFAGTNNKAIEDRINVFIKTKEKSFNYDQILSSIDEIKYELPRRYNEKWKITRFYRVVFMTETEFSNIEDFSTLKSEEFCDGLIINLIRKELFEEEIAKKIDKIGDDSVIIRYPEKVDDYFVNLVNRYAALSEIVSKGGNDQIINSELEILLDETTDDIRGLIEKYFGDDSRFYVAGYEGTTSFRNVLSDQMDKIYNKSIAFNNELVNKNLLTSQYQKPANNVMQWLMDNDSDENFNSLYSPTSPESTIKHAVVEKLNDENGTISEVIYGIKNNIVDSEKKRTPVSEIIKDYVAPPYGIRKGVIQIIVAKAIGELSDNVLLYLEDREIDLNAENLSKSIYGKGNYYIGFAKGSKAQQVYLNRMLSVFGVSSHNNFRNDTKKLCNQYRHFFVGLPQILRNDNDYISGIDPKINEFKASFMKFNINSYEAVYVHAIDQFGTYENAYKVISGFVNNWRNILDQYKEEVSTDIKKLFSIDQSSSLRMGLENFISYSLKGQSPIIDAKNSRIYKVISDLPYDGNSAISMLSYAAIGSYIEDWNSDRKSELIEALNNFKDVISEAKKIDTDELSIDSLLSNSSSVPISEMGQLMETTLQSTFDEYGGSVSNEEKIAILSKMLNKIINSGGTL